MVHKKRGARNNSRLLPHPNVWVVLSVAVLVIGLSVITALGPSSSVTGNTIQNIGRMNKGDPLHLSVQDVPGLEKIITNADEIIKFGQINVDVDESIPFDRPYVSKFTVRSENKFGPLQFTFKVKEQDLLDKGISRYDLRLYHGVKEYSLQLLKIDHGYLYYVVTVPSMGNFVLGRVEVMPKEVKVENVAETPAAEENSMEEKTSAPAEQSEEALVGMAAESSAEAQPGFFAKLQYSLEKYFLNFIVLFLAKISFYCLNTLEKYLHFCGGNFNRMGS